MAVQRVTDDADAVALADRLNRDGRTKPVVVVTIPAARDTPYIDVAAINTEVGDLADIYLVATGPHTWTFSSRMPTGTQVYGGAGRVYPVGLEWATNLKASPLRFAYDEFEGRRATQHLVSDALAMAVSAGLLNRRTSSLVRRVEGVVAGFPHAERAMVQVPGGYAGVAQELTVPGVALDRVLTRGMRVTGLLDTETLRLDVRESLLAPEAALARYDAGAVVLAEVVDVRTAVTTLRLHPEVDVPVERDHVTGNDQDDLGTLLTVGEVVRARVVTRGPRWELSLLDVDDDEQPVAAASLLPGGPPWLVEQAEVVAAEPVSEPAPVVAAPVVAPPAPTSHPVAEVPPCPPAPAPAAPSVPKPSMFDRRPRPATPATTPEAPAEALPTPTPTPTPRPRPATRAEAMARVAAAKAKPTAPAPAALPAEAPKRSAAASQMGLTIAALRSQLEQAQARIRHLEDQLTGSMRERDDLIEDRKEQQRTIAQRDEQLKRARTTLRKARKPVQPAAAEPPEFADRERGFRHAVEAAWARRFPVAEQPQRPLGEYELGPEFLDSIDELHGVSVEKIVDVVVEIATGLVEEMPGRDLHRKRVSAGGGSPYQVREDARGRWSKWRAAIEVNTPQARRIEYWKCGAHVELDNVDLHDARLA